MFYINESSKLIAANLNFHYFNNFNGLLGNWEVEGNLKHKAFAFKKKNNNP